MARIEDYALIGDLQTAALVSRGGSIDWCCFPRFDSGACFAALLGEPRHGRWLLAPRTHVRSVTRRYRSDTLILESVFETDEGTVRAIDFMPPRDDVPDIVRIVEGLDGKVPMRSELVLGGRLDEHEPARPLTARDLVGASAPRLITRVAGACLIAGLGFTTVADAGWAHAIGATCLLAFVAFAFPAALPPDILAEPSAARTEGEGQSL